MGLVSRPVKVAGTGGQTSFVDLVAAGFPDIIDVDFDNDWQALHDVLNGNVDGQNIADASILNRHVAPTAGIVYSKMTLTGGIVNADINAAAAILGSKLANTSVPTGKLAIGSTLAQFAAAAGAWPLIQFPNETVMCTLPAITTRGGPVFVFGSLAVTVVRALAGATTVQFKLYQDGVLVFAWEYLFQVTPLSSIFQLPIPCAVLYAAGVAAGAHTFVLKGKPSSADVQIAASTAGPGALWAVEFA